MEKVMHIVWVSNIAENNLTSFANVKIVSHLLNYKLGANILACSHQDLENQSNCEGIEKHALTVDFRVPSIKCEGFSF